MLCKEKSGACIQCSVKSCKTAYHVTCAFRHSLEMKAIVEDEHSEDGVKLRVGFLHFESNDIRMALAKPSIIFFPLLVLLSKTLDG